MVHDLLPLNSLKPVVSNVPEKTVLSVNLSSPLSANDLTQAGDRETNTLDSDR